MATIVLCEDDPTIRKLIQVALRPLQHTLLVAGDGDTGLALIRRERPSIVLTDLAMPGMDGFQLVDALGEDPELSRTPVLVITASAQRQTIEASRARGVADYLVKPFTAGDLRAAVQRLLP